MNYTSLLLDSADLIVYFAILRKFVSHFSYRVCIFVLFFTCCWQSFIVFCTTREIVNKL